MRILFESVSPIAKPLYQHVGYLSSPGGHNVERIKNVIRQVSPYHAGLNWFSATVALGGLFILGSLVWMVFGRKRGKRLIPKLAFLCAGIILVSSAFMIASTRGPGYVVKKQKVQERVSYDSALEMDAE